MPTVATFALLTALAVSTPALAEPPSLTPLVEPASSQTATTTVTDSYRAQTLTADGLSVGAALLGAALEGPDGRDTTGSSALLPIALLGGAFATPIIHAMHGHGARAIGSYLLRSAAMGAGAIIAVQTATCSPDEFLCGLDRLGPGLLGGFVVAAVIDAAFMTDETHEMPVHPGMAWAPVVTPHPGGATAGFALMF